MNMYQHKNEFQSLGFIFNNKKLWLSRLKRAIRPQHHTHAKSEPNRGYRVNPDHLFCIQTAHIYKAIHRDTNGVSYLDNKSRQG